GTHDPRITALMRHSGGVHNAGYAWVERGGSASMDAFLAGVLAGYGIAVPVGAIALLIVQVGIKCGFRCAFMAGAGAASADLIYAGLAVVGGAGLAQLIDSAGSAFRIGSGLVLITIGVVGLTRANTPVERTDVAMPHRAELASTYARFLGLTVINPTTIVYFAAVVVGLGVASGLTPSGGILFCLGAFAASLSWQTLLAFTGASGGRRMSHKVQVAAMIVGNLLILMLAVAIIIP
ncbi:MAG: LysE family transporter, partial [Acidimicrobiia bacterium]